MGRLRLTWVCVVVAVSAVTAGAQMQQASRTRAVIAAPQKQKPAPPPALKVCVLALNEPHEVAAFRNTLDAKRFEFIDLMAVAAANRPPGAPAPGMSSDESWLMDSCTPATRCDVMVVTAEFAGRFFGTRGSLGLQALEEASCQAKCAGLFQQPMEVFLLACNSLATKNQDERSPQEYLQVLLSHGFDRAAAERVVELRYGPLGPSFRESLRRVFAGVPRIYGFSSVAPRGEITAPMLTRYLKGQGDYATRLVKTRGNASRNGALLTSFSRTSMVQTRGLTPREASAVDRRDICALYDTERSVLERLRITYGFLQRGDALQFVPTLQVFLARHPDEGLSELERSVLTEIRALDGPREQVMTLVDRLNVSALKLELAHFAALVGWLHQSELNALAERSARQLMAEPLTPEVVDIMCAITTHVSLRTRFKTADIAPRAYADPQGLRLLSCLAPRDPRIVAQVVDVLDDPDPVRRQWAAHALTRMVPLDDEQLERLVPYLDDPSSEVAMRVDWTLRSHEDLPWGVSRALSKSTRRWAPPVAGARVTSR